MICFSVSLKDKSLLHALFFFFREEVKKDK